jgi:hypothetical protein
VCVCVWHLVEEAKVYVLCNAFLINNKRRYHSVGRVRDDCPCAGDGRQSRRVHPFLCLSPHGIFMVRAIRVVRAGNASRHCRRGPVVLVEAPAGGERGDDGDYGVVGGVSGRECRVVPVMRWQVYRQGVVLLRCVCMCVYVYVYVCVCVCVYVCACACA